MRSIYNTDMQTYLFLPQAQTGHVILDRSVSRSEMNLLVSVQ